MSSISGNRSRSRSRNYIGNMRSTGSSGMETIMSLCPPALLYLVLYVVSVISQLMGGNFSVAMAIGGLIMAIIWVWFLNYLCRAGYQGLSWFLVFFPVIIMILVLVFLASFAKEIAKDMSPEERKKLVEDIKKN